jgi:hypothetical protein
VNGPGPDQPWLTVSSNINGWAMNGSFVLNAARIIHLFAHDFVYQTLIGRSHLSSHSRAWQLHVEPIRHHHHQHHGFRYVRPLHCILQVQEWGATLCEA